MARKAHPPAEVESIEQRAPLPEVRIETRRISTLRNAPYNPRRISEAALRGLQSSVERFGLVQPIIVNERTGYIVGGHQRVKALKATGATEALVVLVDLPDTEERALNLALNSPAIAGEFTEGLGALLDEVQAADADLFDALMLGEMAEPAPVVAAAVDVEDAGETEPPSDPVARRGGMWRLGDHVLVCGDSRDDADVARLMAGVKSTIAVTSPPYASQRTYDESSGFRPIPPDDFVAWFDAVQRNVRAHMVAAGSWFVNIKAHAEDGQRHLYVNDLLTAHVRSWNWRFVDEICWYKHSMPGVWPDRLRNDWEPVFHFATAKGFPFNPLDVGHASTDAMKYNKENKGRTKTGNIGIPGMRKDERIEGVARPGNVLEISTRCVKNGIEHEAAYPVQLPEFFIKAFSNAGDVVYEPFCGSGTTLIAAHKAGRICRAMEISPAYCDVIIKRWEDSTGIAAVEVGS